MIQAEQQQRLYCATSTLTGFHGCCTVSVLPTGYSPAACLVAGTYIDGDTAFQQLRLIKSH